MVKECSFVLFDPEEEYVYKLMEFMRKQKNLPWSVRCYTREESLFQEELTRQGEHPSQAIEKDWKKPGEVALESNRNLEGKKAGIGILLVAESAYHEGLKELNPKRMVILNESGIVRDGQVININKYQAAANVLQELMEIYVEIADVQSRRLENGKNHPQFLGFYTPVHGCMQTTFALTMGQLLARDHSVLYVNFEHFVGDVDLLQIEGSKDLADLLYFMETQEDKFALHLQVAIQHREGFDFVPPMRSGQNLLSISEREWLLFLQKIESFGEYEYVLLDLSESMQGLFEILRFCQRVFMVVKGDRVSKSKVLQCQQLLDTYGFEDVNQKIRQCSLPKMEELPENMEQYLRGPLAEYSKTCIGQLQEVADVG